MQLKVLKYLLDIESAIDELSLIIKSADNRFDVFKTQTILKRAAERDLQIIGEAISKLQKINSDIKLSHAKKIIGLRNIITHAYDAIDDELIWAILQRDIPALKEEISKLRM
jgi:uncharacterized protein with HEPN domain